MSNQPRWRHRNAATGRPCNGPSPAVTVESIRRFAGATGVYDVRWHDGRRRREILVAVDEPGEAGRVIGTAVASSYRRQPAPAVFVPDTAWR